jgi:hypothetical protein
MRRACKVSLNDQPFLAQCRDLLLDAALPNGMWRAGHRPAWLSEAQTNR